METINNEIYSDDKEIIEQAKNGDSEALKILVEKYQNTIYNFAFKVCRDPEKAFNVTQETFISLIKNLSKYSGQAKLSTWLYAIVSNHCLMEARKKNKEVFVNENEDSFQNDNFLNIHARFNPEKFIENEELKKILDETINKLPEDYKLTFLLRDVEGLSVEETANILNISESAVKTRTHRARSFLKKELAKKLKDAFLI